MAESAANPAPQDPVVEKEEGIYIELTHATLDALSLMNFVRSPKAGAIVLFAGTPPF